VANSRAQEILGEMLQAQEHWCAEVLPRNQSCSFKLKNIGVLKC
jgi:hypothetical protein